MQNQPLPWDHALISGFDTETTGISPWLDRIVEMGVVAWQFKQEVQAHRALCHPGISIPPQATAVHHITDDMVKDLPTWDRSPDVSSCIYRLASSDVIVCANTDFDLGMLRAELWRAEFRQRVRVRDAASFVVQGPTIAAMMAIAVAFPMTEGAPLVDSIPSITALALTSLIPQAFGYFVAYSGNAFARNVRDRLLN